MTSSQRPRPAETTPINAPTFIEIGARDARKAHTFYQGLFDWRFHAMGGNGHWIETPTVRAGLHDGDPEPGMVLYFAVEDLEAALARVKALGGSVTPNRSDNGEFGHFVECQDDQGIKFGLRRLPRVERDGAVHSALTTGVHLRSNGSAAAVTTDNAFWAALASGSRTDMDDGRLVCQFQFDADWGNWERHPAGEEMVFLISGAADFVLEVDGSEQAHTLRAPGDFVLVPPGVWHTARTATPTTILLVTPGAGTEHRPARG